MSFTILRLGAGKMADRGPPPHLVRINFKGKKRYCKFPFLPCR